MARYFLEAVGFEYSHVVYQSDQLAAVRAEALECSSGSGFLYQITDTQQPKSRGRRFESYQHGQLLPVR